VADAISERFTLHIRNSIDAIAPAVDTATAWLNGRQASATDIWFVNLAVDELVSNCVKYAYADSQEHVIDVELQIVDQQLIVTVIDDGRAFDPLTIPPPDMSLAAEDRKIGGLGIHLLLTVSEKMTYERRDNQNRVVLVKKM
jgi:anti-sigma regulatory factor (Ser/Thr protein kinase)